MGPPAVSLVLVVVLGLTATLPTGPTMVHAEASSVPDEDTTTTTNMTRVENQCSPLQRRQDLLDNRLNERDTRLNELHKQLNQKDTRLNELHTQLNVLDNHTNTQQTEVNTRFNRIDSRLDGIERAISDMKEYLQEQMEAMNKKVEWALTDIKPVQDENVREQSQVYGGCQEALTQGVTTSGIYTIAPDQGNSFNVYCEQRLDGGGWTVFQVRYNGSVNFYLDWEAYKNGFGALTGEFWLGNNQLHLLTKHHDQQLKIELTSPSGEVKYADYSQFAVADESQKYRLNVTGYSGGSIPGDSLAYHNGQSFSTRDQDNDRKTGEFCAGSYSGCWWYNECHQSNLNGQYGNTDYGKGLNWYHWKGHHISLKATRMMIRKRP